MTTNSPAPTLPAEWEQQQAVLMAWPHAATDWAPILADARECFSQIARAILQRASLIVATPQPDQAIADIGLNSLGHSLFIAEMPTNDTWARDFGPITMRMPGGEYSALDFTFNGWGMKFAACHDNQINTHLAQAGVLRAGTALQCMMPFVLEGGSIESDGQGSILTTSQCLLAPNRNQPMTRAQIEAHLLGAFAAQRVLWLDHGYLAGDDTDSHVDTLARFIAPDAIAFSACDRPADEHYAELEAMRAELQALRTPQGKPYRLVELPIPNPIYDPDCGERLPATYANFLILNGAVLLPVYADEAYDALAISRLQAALPEYEIVPIDCRTLIRQHGSLHCVTMQLPWAPSITPQQ